MADTLTARARAWQAGSAEARLLLAVAAPAAAREAALARALATRIDWGGFAALALRHRLAPLAGERLAVCEAVPAAVRAGLAQVLAENRRRDALLTAELVLLARRLRAAGVPFVSLKGPALAHLADGGAGLRTVIDLDLLIDPARAAEASAMLVARGYRRTAAVAETGQDDQFVHHATGLRIELHHRLYKRAGLPFAFALSDEDAGRNAASLLGQAIPLLPEEDNLLYLAFHGAKHGWTRLAWLTAFAGLAQQCPGDPARLRARAAALGLETSFALALRLVSLALPDAALPQRGWPRAPAGLAERLLARMLAVSGVEGSAEALLAFAADALAGRGTVTGPGAIDARVGSVPPDTGWALARYVFALRGRRVRHLLEVLFTPRAPDLALFGRPASARGFYAVARPLRLLGRGITRRVRPRR